MITVRPYRPEDLALVERVSEARGVWMQDPTDPIVFGNLTAEHDGRPVAVLSARRTLDLWLSLDPTDLDPRSRWEAFRALVEPMRTLGREAGYLEMHAAVPDRFRSFARRLALLPGAEYDVRHRIIFSAESAGEPTP